MGRQAQSAKLWKELNLILKGHVSREAPLLTALTLRLEFKAGHRMQRRGAGAPPSELNHTIEPSSSYCYGQTTLRDVRCNRYPIGCQSTFKSGQTRIESTEVSLPEENSQTDTSADFADCADMELGKTEHDGEAVLFVAVLYV